MTTMRAAAAFLMVSALLHLAGAVLSGVSVGGAWFLGAAVAWVLLYAGLMRGLRWIAWLTLLLMFAGLSAGVAIAMGAAAGPAWLGWAIVAANALVILTLFVTLWRDPEAD